MGNSQQSASLRLISASTEPGNTPIYPLSETHDVVLGRTPTCEVVIDSKQYGGVSRRHAVVCAIGLDTQGEARWQICDLHSVNGTYVNGQKIQGCQVLQVGDRITLSRNGPQFVFEQGTNRGPQASIQSPLIREPYPVVQAPIPLQNSDLTMSQLIPIVSVRQDLLHKGYLVPGILTVIFVVLLFVAQGNLFNWLLALYLGCGGFYFIYRLCGKRKPWWVLIASTLFTVMMLKSPVLQVFIWVFRDILPGNVEAASASYIPQLISHFFGAGMMEELLKAIPIFGCLLWGAQLRSPHRERIGVWEPLDGILIGAASALGFTWLETLGQYVPGVIQEVAETAGADAAADAGLQLLIPRILGSVAGHMAYSGIFGYFIGLSMLKPARRWQIMGIGYGVSSGLHAFWNATGGMLGGKFGLIALMVVGIAAYAFLVAAILKARQLSPNRVHNFATWMGGPPS